MSIYGISFGVGFAVGSLFVPLIDISESLPFIISSALFVVASLLLFVALIVIFFGKITKTDVQIQFERLFFTLKKIIAVKIMASNAYMNNAKKLIPPNVTADCSDEPLCEEAS